MRCWYLGGISLIISCAPCYNSQEPNYTSYSVHRTDVSKFGYGIDDHGLELDRTRLDSIVEDVRDCVLGVLPLTEDEISQGECVTEPIPEIRSCLTIMVAPDWHVSCTGEQVFGTAPDASCTVKGEQPTPQCPCAFRAIIQDNCTIITTPNMKILAGQLTTLMTSCNNAWVGRLNKCATISLNE
jgi:hypothetical protein